eukprot:TRINITY_DN4228_c1_g3_i2.p1 TRINITY_DN4228_c1_g3~~TRINITY_DN4228_c1_g3_i2.p1  ORF type:complete len:204 (-),score=39.27 TRINITY_DN4228_c1_g3_i2:124-735(-)
MIAFFLITNSFFETIIIVYFLRRQPTLLFVSGEMCSPDKVWFKTVLFKQDKAGRVIPSVELLPGDTNDDFQLKTLQILFAFLSPQQISQKLPPLSLEDVLEISARYRLIKLEMIRIGEDSFSYLPLRGEGIARDAHHTCSCRAFASKGMCNHLLAVLIHFKLIEVPEKFKCFGGVTPLLCGQGVSPTRHRSRKRSPALFKDAQ